MNTQAAARLESAFEQAERSKSCLVAVSERDQKWLKRAAAHGDVLGVQPGIFARSDYWKSLSKPQRMLHIMRAMCRANPCLVFAGPCAALAHGLEVGNSDLDTLCCATTRSAHAKRKVGIRQIIVSGDTPTTRKGIRVTSFARTIYDCLRTLSFPAALAIADSALRIKGISAERLYMNVRKACRIRRGMRRVRDIIFLADGRSENGGESKVRAMIISLGFEGPDLQREVQDPLDLESSYRVDFVWDLGDGSTVFGELDGKDKYVDPRMTNGQPLGDTLLNERRREARITVSKRPVRVMRFSFGEACNADYFARLLEAYGIPKASEVPIVAQG